MLRNSPLKGNVFLPVKGFTYGKFFNATLKLEQADGGSERLDRAGLLGSQCLSDVTPVCAIAGHILEASVMLMHGEDLCQTICFMRNKPRISPKLTFL